MAVNIHPTAIVDPGASIAQDAVVGPYCIVEDNVVIGSGSKLDAYAQVRRNTTMGSGNHVHSFAIVGGDPQHLGYKGEDTTVEIGDNNIIREHVTIHKGTMQGFKKTTLGSGCFLMAYSHVAHDCLIGNNVIMANASSLAGHVEVGDNVIISGMSGVHQFVRIGEFAFLGAMGGFGQDIPPFTLATGVRAKLHGLNLIGLRRNGVSRQSISALKKAYQLIWRSELIREEALEEVERSFGDVAEVQRLVEFIRSSKRGVTPAGGDQEESFE